MSSTTMTCVSPSYLGTAPQLTNISYTIQVGYALGPNLLNESLTITAVPDPIFATDGTAIIGNIAHVIGSGTLLRIKVSLY